MSESDTIERIRAVAERRKQADQARREATADLQRLICDAQAQGEAISRIALEAGLSRQGVYNLLAAPPS